MSTSEVEPKNNLVVAVIGNPNTGKTTLFNALTGLRQHVGNYPGVTVERKTGSWRLDENTTVDLLDLPGTYSLAARSPDEMIAVDVLLGQQKGAPKVDAILAIADASNPERNFYLISQLCELKLPVVVALNMCDVAASKGITVETSKIAAMLGTEVVPLCANKGTGVAELAQAVLNVLSVRKAPQGTLPKFPDAMCAEIDALTAKLHESAVVVGRDVNRLEAFRVLVDKGGYAEQRLVKVLGENFCNDLEERRKRASKIPLPAEEVRTRYAWVKSVLNGAVTRPAQPPTTRSDRIDKVLTHWFSGTLAFLLVMLFLFQAIFSWASPLMDQIKALFGGLNGWVGAQLAEGTLRSLVCDGVIAGVGGVLVFIPQICILFAFIAILEDCGYMSRAAFLMDRLFSKLGLSGKSFIPMLSSFACAVPGIMATRTIENPRDRLTTILISPLMSCSARLPVYIILIRTFIPDGAEHHYLGGYLTLQGLIFFAMYWVGILVAIPMAWLLKKTLLRGETPPFLIELPSYKIPDWKTVLMRVYSSGKAFTLRAGTVILAVSIVVWALAYFPRSETIAKEFETRRIIIQADATLDSDAMKEAMDDLDNEQSGSYLRESYFGKMGRTVEPVFKPLGWDWRISMAAIASFPAREVIVATLGTIFNLGNETDAESDTLRDALKNATWDEDNSAAGSAKVGRKLFNIPVALSVMVFFALCSQCAATLATIRRETNSWHWPLFSFFYMTTLAYVAALITYQVAAHFLL